MFDSDKKETMEFSMVKKGKERSSCGKFTRYRW